MAARHTPLDDAYSGSALCTINYAAPISSLNYDLTSGAPPGGAIITVSATTFDTAEYDNITIGGTRTGARPGRATW